MMRIIYLTALLLVLSVQTGLTADKQVSYEEEMYTLGTVSGQGLACKSKKYHQFELLARALIVGKAASQSIQQIGMERYNTGKVDAFAAMADGNFAGCAETLKAFENQQIFKAVLYSDGRVKLYDGTIITPRKPYDASKLYQKDREAYIKANNAYKKFVAEASKNALNVKKVPLRDSNYEKFAKEFSN